jgi:hypothetical protein
VIISVIALKISSQSFKDRSRTGLVSVCSDMLKASLFMFSSLSGQNKKYKLMSGPHHENSRSGGQAIVNNCDEKIIFEFRDKPVASLHPSPESLLKIYHVPGELSNA